MPIKVVKFFALLLCLLLCFEQSSFAQVAGELDISGHILQLRNSLIQDKFRPLHLRYLSYNPVANNFRLLLDKGDLKNLSSSTLEDSTHTLLNYFFVGISLPNSSFWVNLRPDSENQIIDDALAKTDVGKILLEADLQLKKDTAKFTSPETPEGKEYWEKLYQKASELFGSSNISIPTLTRPWIVPDEIIIREAQENAYIYKATLKVMLEQDYLKGSSVYNFNDDRLKTLNEYSSQIIREKIIPKLTKEINTSKRYASLRQVYYSLILAQWFKQRFYGKSGLYSWLIDKQNLTGLTSKTLWSKTTYFKEYQKSFKEGEYNIKAPVYTLAGQTIRNYMSGGVALMDTKPAIELGGAVTAGARDITRIPNRFSSSPISIQGGSVEEPSNIRVVIEKASSPLAESSGALLPAEKVRSNSSGGPSIYNTGIVTLTVLAMVLTMPFTTQIVAQTAEAEKAEDTIAKKLEINDINNLSPAELEKRLLLALQLKSDPYNRLAQLIFYLKDRFGFERTAWKDNLSDLLDISNSPEVAAFFKESGLPPYMLYLDGGSISSNFLAGFAKLTQGNAEANVRLAKYFKQKYNISYDDLGTITILDPFSTKEAYVDQIVKLGRIRNPEVYFEKLRNIVSGILPGTEAKEILRLIGATPEGVAKLLNFIQKHRLSLKEPYIDLHLEKINIIAEQPLPSDDFMQSLRFADYKVRWITDLPFLYLISRDKRLRTLFFNHEELLSTLKHKLSAYSHLIRDYDMPYSNLEEMDNIMLVKALLILESLDTATLQWIGEIINKDLADETTEYAGYLYLDLNNSKLSFVLVPPDKLVGDENYYAAMTKGVKRDPDFILLSNFHLHAVRKEGNPEYAGPSRNTGDTMISKIRQMDGIVITHLGRYSDAVNGPSEFGPVKFSIHLYRGGDYVISLGILSSSTQVFSQATDTQKAQMLIIQLGVEHESAVEAAWRLVTIGPPAVPALMEALKDKDVQVRVGVAWVLGRIKFPPAVPALMEALKDKSERVRFEVARALINIASSEALKEVLRSEIMLKHEDLISEFVIALRDAHVRINNPMSVKELNEILFSYPFSDRLLYQLIMNEELFGDMFDLLFKEFKQRLHSSKERFFDYVNKQGESKDTIRFLKQLAIFSNFRELVQEFPDLVEDIAPILFKDKETIISNASRLETIIETLLTSQVRGFEDKMIDYYASMSDSDPRKDILKRIFRLNKDLFSPASQAKLVRMEAILPIGKKLEVTSSSPTSSENVSSLRSSLLVELRPVVFKKGTAKPVFGVELTPDDIGSRVVFTVGKGGMLVLRSSMPTGLSRWRYLEGQGIESAWEAFRQLIRERGLGALIEGSRSGENRALSGGDPFVTATFSLAKAIYFAERRYTQTTIQIIKIPEGTEVVIPFDVDYQVLVPLSIPQEWVVGTIETEGIVSAEDKMSTLKEKISATLEKVGIPSAFGRHGYQFIYENQQRFLGTSVSEQNLQDALSAEGDGVYLPFPDITEASAEGVSVGSPLTDTSTASSTMEDRFVPVNPASDKGGIDFRALPIVTQPMNTPGANLNIVPISRLDNINLDAEWQHIQNMIQAGIIPSSERIKEYLQACYQKEGFSQEIDKMLASLADILRLEEDEVLPTDSAFKEILTLLESDKSAKDLQFALSKITVLSKEPKLIEQ